MSVKFDSESYYSLDDLSQLMEVKPHTARRWIKSGVLDSVKIGHRHYVSSKSLKKMMEHGTRVK